MSRDILFETTESISFPIYPSLPIDKSSKEYSQNITDWTKVISKYQQALQWSASQGTNHYEERHKERGLLLGISKTYLLVTGTNFISA